MNKWYKPQMLTDFVRAAYMLSPHPLVMDHAKKHKDPEDRRAVERLIDKLLLPKDIVNDEVRMNSSAQLMDEFWKEHADFWAKRGNFRDPRRFGFLLARMITNPVNGINAMFFPTRIV